uniref:uncharacterized protein n=1 Tax=Semicossyphus pulcher TaxID=241346 RepID=UPI0037E8D158
MDIHGADDQPGREPPIVRHYQASELLPVVKGPLHDLLQKQPAVLGSLQMVSGLLSVGVGIVFAASQNMDESLFTLFRVSQLTGALFIIAGVVSNLLFKYPELLATEILGSLKSFTMACAVADMDIHGADEQPGREPPIVRHYQASELLPVVKGPLHDLLQKQPAVLGSLQMVSGLLSVGVGIVFAATQNMDESLFTLFRVSQLTGALFIIAGVVSNLLFKYPELLAVSLMVNCGCIVVAVVAACLISVDLANWSALNDDHMRIEVLELCVLGLEAFLSAVLCFWFFKEKRAKSQ